MYSFFYSVVFLGLLSWNCSAARALLRVLRRKLYQTRLLLGSKNSHLVFFEGSPLACRNGFQVWIIMNSSELSFGSEIIEVHLPTRLLAVLQPQRKLLVGHKRQLRGFIREAWL